MNKRWMKKLVVTVSFCAHRLPVTVMTHAPSFIVNFTISSSAHPAIFFLRSLTLNVNVDTSGYLEASEDDVEDVDDDDDDVDEQLDVDISTKDNIILESW